MAEVNFQYQRFGIEIELTGITREAAANITGQYFNKEVKHPGGQYDEYNVRDAKKRKWKIVSDSSISPYRMINGQPTMVRDQYGSKNTYKVEIVSPILVYADIETLQGLVNRIKDGGGFVNASCGIHIHIDGANHSLTSLVNILKIVASKEELIYKALEINPVRESFCKRVNTKLLNNLENNPPKTMEQLADFWYEDFSMLSRSEHYNRSRYHGINLHSYFTHGTVEFRLFNSTVNADLIKSYIQFCMAVSHQAITQKFSSSKRAATDNEKYTFRTWLLRLGLIGNEYKVCRQQLLANLEGNAAWRHIA